MDTHLEEQPTKIQAESPAVRNRRNGHSRKTIKGEFGEAEIIFRATARVRRELILVNTGQTRFDGLKGKILARQVQTATIIGTAVQIPGSRADIAMTQALLH